MLLNIRQLMDDAKCYVVVRELRWPDGVKCPACDPGQINGKRGFHDHQAHRQRYSCQECGRQFDDVSGPVSEGHRQDLKTWILCLYLMGLNLTNRQIAEELDLNNEVDVEVMASRLPEGVMAKKSR
jgi:transposase-like protein